MEALYHQTNRLLQETQECFQHLSLNKPEADKEIQARIDQITRYRTKNVKILLTLKDHRIL